MALAQRKWFIYVCLLAAAFLFGYIPQYWNSRQCRSDLKSLQWRLDVAGLRERMGLAYLEVNRKNYGLAREQASQFFTRAHELAAQAPDAKFKAALEAALARRDEITASLAKGEERAREEIERLFGELHQQTAGPQ